MWFFQPFSSFNDEKIKGTSTAIRKSQLVIMLMFNLMTKNNVNLTVPLMGTVVLIHFRMAK